jgi:hypothetical protein
MMCTLLSEAAGLLTPAVENNYPEPEDVFLRASRRPALSFNQEISTFNQLCAAVQEESVEEFWKSNEQRLPTLANTCQIS